MNSSTSHSKPLFGVLVAALAASYLAGAIYTIWINPEIRFWKAAYAVKTQHARELDSKGIPKTVFAGGSSCAFQIDPVILEKEFNFPSVNMGMHAGMGAQAIVALALSTLKPGDTLVLNIEPHLLSGKLDVTPLGMQMLMATGNLSYLSKLPCSAPSKNLAAAVVAMRPGLRNIVTMAGKLASGRPLYRYQRSEIHSGGFVTTEEKGAVPLIGGVAKISPSAEALALLNDIRLYSSSHDYTLRYLLPWVLVEPKDAAPSRQNLTSATEAYGGSVSILDDGQSGIHTEKADFADTALHLTREGAEQRTRHAGRVLAK